MMNVVLKKSFNLVLSNRSIALKAGDKITVDVIKGIAYHFVLSIYFDIDKTDYVVSH